MTTIAIALAVLLLGAVYLVLTAWERADYYRWLWENEVEMSRIRDEFENVTGDIERWKIQHATSSGQGTRDPSPDPQKRAGRPGQESPCPEEAS